MAEKDIELIQKLQSDWQYGFKEAMDPNSKTAVQKDGTAVTTSSSPWIHVRCPRCAHTFRSGDSVSIVGDRVQHHDTSLFCGLEEINTTAQQEENQNLSPEAEDFFNGLDDAWPPPKDIHVIRLEAGHRLLAPPIAGFRRRNCLMCGHTFRPHDRVVICPCNPKAPLCGAAIHRDPIRGLNCFQSWNPGGSSAGYCPVTSRQL